MHVLNAWYAAAWSEEVGRDLLARTVCDKALVLYRTEEGEPVALADACWHRLVPLSMGRLRGDDLMCGYHGIGYSPQGRCTFMPSQETINPSASVASYPVVDRYRMTWVWLGNPELADPDDIPDVHWATDPEWAGGGELLHLECEYRLVLDNLMDLTHETFLHGNSIGHAAVAAAPFQVEHTENTVTVSRWMFDVDAPPAFVPELKMRFPDYAGERVDRWQIIRWEAPSTIVLDVGVALAGSGAERGDFSKGVRGRVLNMITPETERTSNYFWLRMRDHSLDDEAFTDTHRGMIHNIFEEDRAMLEAQQVAIERHVGYDFYNLNIDAGGLWVRRLIDRLAAAEAESPAAASSGIG